MYVDTQFRGVSLLIRGVKIMSRLVATLYKFNSNLPLQTRLKFDRLLNEPGYERAEVRVKNTSTDWFDIEITFKFPRNIPYNIVYVLDEIMTTFQSNPANYNALAELLIHIGAERVADGGFHGNKTIAVRCRKDPLSAEPRRQYCPIFRGVDDGQAIFMHHLDNLVKGDEGKRDYILRRMAEQYCTRYTLDSDCKCINRLRNTDYSGFLSAVDQKRSNLGADSCWYVPCSGSVDYLKDPNLPPCMSKTCMVLLDASNAETASFDNNIITISGCTTELPTDEKPKVGGTPAPVRIPSVVRKILDEAKKLPTPVLVGIVVACAVLVTFLFKSRRRD